MKLISREEVTEMIRNERPEIFYIPEGRVLSPAAKDFLNEQCIRFDGAKRQTLNEKNGQSDRYLNHNYTSRNGAAPAGGNHGDLSHTKSGGTSSSSHIRFYGFQKQEHRPSKPEEMTSISGDTLVLKDNPVIQYRGKLDSAQAQTVFVQSVLSEKGCCKNLLADLDDLLETMREVMRAEVLGEPVRKVKIIGLTSEELREQSHEPEKYFGIKKMQPPSYESGTAYAGLNLIRTAVREAEVLAVHAFRNGNTVERKDIIETLNRLSSACHVLMCRYLAGYYTRN